MSKGYIILAPSLLMLCCCAQQEEHPNFSMRIPNTSQNLKYTEDIIRNFSLSNHFKFRNSSSELSEGGRKTVYLVAKRGSDMVLVVNIPKPDQLSIVAYGKKNSGEMADLYKSLHQKFDGGPGGTE